ncbi:hypothetical protein [Streptomyces sp. NPDC093223]|uniref:hypothetical protein n=1 Tax=Streptomyces sp. NPDC093223 TaxID=3366033 RepID=UPI00381347A3
MKAPDEQPTEPQAEQETPGEEDEPTGRGPAIALSVLGAVAAWRLVAAFPEVALIAAGSLGTIGVQQARARWAGRAEEVDADAEEVEAPDIAEALRTLVGADNGVLLTRLQKYLSLPNTKAVKQLLDAAGITWKGVRTSGGNGPGVHKNDIPAAVISPVTDVHGNGCCCRSDDNGNSDNAHPGGHGEGIRVERTDGGLLIHDLGDRGRHGSARS